MKISMNLPVMVPGLDREHVLAWSRRIDAGPYETLCAGERIAFPNPEVMVALSVAAGVTERVKIMPSVIVLPMHPAVRMAKQLATLDVLSGGRLVVGVGAGAREEDFRASEARFDGPRLAKLAQQVDVMRRVWAGENVVEGALRPVEPYPAQPGGPEILAGSIFPKAIRKAARWADGLNGFSFGPDPNEIGSGFEVAREAWREAGRPAPRLTTSFWFALGEDGRAQMDAYLERYLGFMGPHAAKALAPTVTTTSAAALRDALKRIADLGADEVMLVPTTLDPDDVDRVADLVG